MLLAEQLRSPDQETLNRAWSTFFLDPDLVLEFLATSSPEAVQDIISCGDRWDGGGWDTTKAAKRVRALTGLALVSSNLRDYLNAFVFSLALAAGVAVPSLDLPDKPAEVSFSLCDLWRSSGSPSRAGEVSRSGRARGAAQAAGAAGEESDEEDEETGDTDVCLPWEVPVVPLHPDLLRCVQRAAAGDRFPAAAMLEECPVYEGLKQRAETNNHSQDAKSWSDKQLKGYQQRCLNILRVIATIYPSLQSADVGVGLQQLFYYVLETEHLLLRDRKRKSIPGSVADNHNVLFTGEDLKAERQVQQINAAGMGMYPPPK